IRKRLYVATRFNNGIAIVDTTSNTEIGAVEFFSPESASVIAGRRLFYDATRSSGNGESSCSSCHVFANWDALDWDLGDPDGLVQFNPMSQFFIGVPLTNNVFQGGVFPVDKVHPMKGPMLTQNLHGIAGNGPLHWRGDRIGDTHDLTNVRKNLYTFSG